MAIQAIHQQIVLIPWSTFALKSVTALESSARSSSPSLSSDQNRMRPAHVGRLYLQTHPDDLHSMKLTSLPVRPPTRFNILPALRATPVNAGPAELVTLDKPSDALDVADDAASAALEAPVAAAFAACDVVEFCLAAKRHSWR